MLTLAILVCVMLFLAVLPAIALGPGMSRETLQLIDAVNNRT